ncbi:transposase family protein [Kitasatospora sp. NPDC087314]|uniref:transposase family protein n=1 Tax=Kitasatospora sp. NPDC087314 TaxID=3364068 RepID=UPI00381D1CC7
MTKTEEPTGDTVPLVYKCRLPLSTSTVTHLADLLRRHLKAIGSRWRALPPGRIAVIVLAVLRHDQRLADMAGGNGVSATTVRRWRDELIGLLAAKAPRLDRALKNIAKRGGEVVLVDGTLIPTQRRTGKDNRPNYSGKHHRPGLRFLALTDEKGRLVWISAARPGRTHDITAARRDHLRDAGLGALADPGFLGLDDDPDDPVVVTGFKATRARKLTLGQKVANRILAAGRAPVEHGFAHLKNWRILTKLRTAPVRATELLRALRALLVLLVLTNLEVAR